MDPETLCHALNHTLNPDPASRQQAEAALKQVHAVPGFLTELLKIAASESVEPGVRQASSIYFKNLVRREWSGPTNGTPCKFGDDEKAVVRDNLLEVLVLGPSVVRAQMALAMQKIVNTDFPEKWPGLFPGVMQNLQSGDERRVMGAMISLRVLGKNFEFARGEQAALDTLVSASFPALLDLFRLLLKQPEPSLDTYNLQKLVCQVFWSATHYDVPAYLRKPTAFRPWMDVFMAALKQPVAGVEADDAAQHPGWKAKKWVAELLLRLFSRYGDPKLCTGSKQTAKFAERFMKE
jgi:hypothetical protein